MTPLEEHAGVLMLRYLDSNLDQSGVDELDHLLRTDPAILRQFSELLVLESHLRKRGRELRELREASARDPRAGTNPFDDLWSWFRRLRWAFAAGTGAALAVAALYFFLLAERLPTHARLTRVDGHVTVERSGRQRDAVSGSRLVAGDRMKLDTKASVVLEAPGGSWVIWNSADLRFQGDPSTPTVSLQSGALRAMASSKATEKPIQFSTPLVKASGTEADFTLLAATNATRVQVWSGKLSVSHAENGPATELTADQSAVARPGRPLVKVAIRHGVLRDLSPDPAASNGRDERNSVRSDDLPMGPELVTSFESDKGVPAKTLARMRGYVRPPSTGLYRFWVAGDGPAELWLSSDDDPDHKSRLCATRGSTAVRDWDRDAPQASGPVWLLAGRPYYIETVQHGVGGTNGLSVAWLVPGGQRQVIPGDRLLTASGSDL